MVNVIPSVSRLRRSLLVLLCCLHVASACIQCDHRVRKEIEDYIEEYVDTNPENIVDPGKIRGVRDVAYGKYKIEADKTSNGVIDQTTLYRVTTEFLNAFKSFKETKEMKIINFIMMIDYEGLKILKKHLNILVSEGGVCPNKCGSLQRKVKVCTLNEKGTCQNEVKDCSKQLDCGVSDVRAREGDATILDCLLPWHGLVSRRKEYRYSWACGTHAPAEGDFRTLLVSEEPGMVLNQLRVDQWGTYRCLLQDRRDGTLISRTTFRLHVEPAPAQTPGPPLTLPTLPAPADPALPLLHTVCVAVTTLCLAASVAVTVLLGAMMRRRGRRLAEED